MDRKDCIAFNSSAPFTLGCEIEFQLLDPDSLGLKSRSVEILDSLTERYRPRIKQEFIQSMVEVCTGICRDVHEIRKDLADTIHKLESLAEDSGCILFASSLHPFSRFEEQKIFPDPRYKKILEELGIVGRRLITQGLHCHVGLEGAETAISVFDRLRPWLPLFLAISASSPFFQGRDTGFSSYRSKLFDALPRSGVPQKLGSWQYYCDFVRLLKKYGIIEAPRDIWWDVRPSPDFGTVEVRICDVPDRLEKIVALSALIQAMVKALAEGRLQSPDMHIAVIQSNKWQAARYGLQGRFVSMEESGRKSMAEKMLELLERLEPVFMELDSASYLPVLEEMTVQGPCSKRLRELARDTKDLGKAILRIQKEFWM